MHQQAGLYFYKFRFVLASLSTAAFLVVIAALVTAIGAHSVLDTKARGAVQTLDMNAPDSPNAVTAGAYQLVGGVQRALLSVGTALYGTCRSVTGLTTRSGDTVAHAGAAVVVGTWHGATFVGRGVATGVVFTMHGVGEATVFTARLPGEVLGSVTSGSGQAVSSIIQPTDDTTPIPVITAPSPAELARLSAQQRQEIADWQASQVTANKSLGGSVVAGDTNHGGYPAQWDNARQDSQIDSWGMYNRECVSYAAWKVYETYGNMPYWGGVGNANEWPRDARRAGVPTGSVPQVHSVAISLHGYYGHAMWVEKVQGDMIYVSQYNYDLHGHYSEMWLNGGGLTYLYFK